MVNFPPESVAGFAGIHSYILGFALRLIRPTILEKISFLLWSPLFITKSIYEYFKNKKAKNGTKFSQILIPRVKAYWESFPYIEWFYSDYFTNSANSVNRFFNDLLTSEYNDKKNCMKSTGFINQIKIYIQEHSKSLYDELMFCEGLVRFLSGMSSALLISILTILIKKADVSLLLYVYILLAILFLLKLRHIRVKEVATILISFAFIKESINDKYCQFPRLTPIC